jgi:hypothetical protein
MDEIRWASKPAAGAHSATRDLACMRLPLVEPSVNELNS